MNQAKTVKSHFDQMGREGTYARFYEPADTPMTHDFLTRLARVHELLDPYLRPGDALLDLGCGTGPLIDYVCGRGAAYHGVDVAPAMLAAIEQKYKGTDYWPRITLETAPCERLPYPTGYFRVVSAMGLIEYLDDLPLALREMSRVTAPGGVLLLTAPNRLSVNRIVMRHAGFVTRLYHAWKKLSGSVVPPDSTIHHREFTPRMLDRAMASAGCRPIGAAHYDYRLLCYPFTRLFPDFAFLVNQRIENRGPSALANGFIRLYETMPATGVAR